MRHLPSELVRAWKRWFKVIEDVSMGHAVERRMTHEQYRQWHDQLISLCSRHGVHPYRASAKTAREMGEIAQEWDSLEKVQLAEPDELLRTVAQVEVQLKGRIRTRGLVLSVKRVVWGLIFLAIVGLIVTYFYDRSIIESIPREMRRIFRSMTRFARREREQFYGITILIAVVGGVVLYSTKKS